MNTVYTKTPKGVRESTGKTRHLSGDLRDLLDLCKGLFTIEDISVGASPSAKEWFAASIAKLVAEGYLRDVPEAMQKKEAAAAPAGDDLDSLDFSKPSPGAAKKAAEDERRRQEEDRIRRLEEEKALKEAKEKARREAEDKVRREVEEKVRREMEEKARREAEEKARRETEDRIRREAEEKV
ncbi:MAG: hypothetical protein FIA96_03900, partial [Betaproteobacteria bacterium]|nr:hypothetical protein [Betaproteobacteria bacterium]